MASVRIQNVGKDYGSVTIMKGINVDIEDGEFVVLVGPSGCGKSTLLRMVAGLESITDGTISIDDRVVNTLPPKERDIAMVFQNYALYPQMTVAENMSFSLRLKRSPKGEIEEKVRKAADILGLDALLERYPRQLSGGQRQRVAMGRAIVRNPKVFLFDEPLSNLDAKLRVQMRGEIKDLQSRLGTTTIYVTHDQIEAMTMADKIVVLNGGNIEQIGSPMDLFDRPANIFVAGFIGSPAMNFIKGTIANSGGLKLKLDGGLELRVSKIPKIEDNSPVVFGIRPENIQIDPENGAPATIEVVEPTGSEVYIVATIGDQRFVCISRQRAIYKRGDAIPLSFTNANAHYFDPKTGKRIAIQA